MLLFTFVFEIASGDYDLNMIILSINTLVNAFMVNNQIFSVYIFMSSKDILVSWYYKQMNTSNYMILNFEQSKPNKDDSKATYKLLMIHNDLLWVIGKELVGANMSYWWKCSLGTIWYRHEAKNASCNQHFEAKSIIYSVSEFLRISVKDDPSFAPSQWETALLCNDVSHWLGANQESSVTVHADIPTLDFIPSSAG